MVEALQKDNGTRLELTDEPDVLEYVKSVPELRARTDGSATLSCRRLGADGVNRTFEVLAGAKPQAIVKQSLRSVHAWGEEWPLEHRHALFERRALELYDSICPGAVPEIYHSDAARGILVLQHLGELKTLAQHWHEGARQLPAPEDVARFCAETLFRTSDYFLSTDQRMTLVEYFAPNMELAALANRRLFLNPYITPQCHPVLVESSRFAVALSLLRRERMRSHECLCHGRLGGNTIATTDSSVYILGPTYASFGPIGLDTGSVCGQMLSLALQHGEDGVAVCVGWITAFWERFESEFRSLWRQENHGDGTPADFFDCIGDEQVFESIQGSVMRDALVQTAGFAGCELIACAWENPREPAAPLQQRIGEELVAHYDEFGSIHDIGAFVKVLSPSGAILPPD